MCEQIGWRAKQSGARLRASSINDPICGEQMSDPRPHPRGARQEAAAKYDREKTARCGASVLTSRGPPQYVDGCGAKTGTWHFRGLSISDLLIGSKPSGAQSRNAKLPFAHYCRPFASDRQRRPSQPVLARSLCSGHCDLCALPQ